MLYHQAFKQGRTAQGRVRCTFASIYLTSDPANGWIFSFQSIKFRDYVCFTDYKPAIRKDSLISAELTDEAVSVLEYYWNNMIRHTFTTTPTVSQKASKAHQRAEALSELFYANGAYHDTIQRRTVYINPHSFDWVPDVIVTNKTKSNMAWAIAAGAALLDN